MSEVRVNLYEPDAGTHGDQDGASPDTVKCSGSEASSSDLQGLLPSDQPTSADDSPSPSAEEIGFLSLPWETLTHIASHLPAQCVMTVLPKVCHALGNVAKDSLAWQLRARRLVGSRPSFPVGPRQDFDWPSACLEMEQLIACWTGQEHLVARQAQEDEEGSEQGGLRCPPSPPPALEHITISSGRIAKVISVLLLGGEGAVCATGSRYKDVKLWDLQASSESDATLLYTLGGQGDFTHQGWVSCLASQGPLLASGCFGSTVMVWDLQAGGAGKSLIKAGAPVLCLSYQSDLLLAGTLDDRVSIYDTRAAEPLVKSLHVHGNSVWCLAADDKYIISGSGDNTVAVYDRRAGQVLQRLQLSSALLSMSYGGSEVWGGDNSGMINSFSMQTGTFKLLSQFDVGHTGAVTGIHRSPGSLYTCSCDHTVKVHIPCAPPRTLCTLHQQNGVPGVNGMSVEAGVLAFASGAVGVEVWRPRK